MSLGGGMFTSQNKVLPGTYINFYSTPMATATIADRGTAAMAFELDWGPENEIFEVLNADFYKNAQKFLGYSYDNPKMLVFRELFKNARSVLCYRLGTGVKASNEIATAKYSGIRGNNIAITIAKDIDDETRYVVSTSLDGIIKDVQYIKSGSELLDNDYVCFKKDISLTTTAGNALTGGSNGTATGEDYQNFLDKLESYTYNILGCASTDDKVKSLFASYTKRMRDEIGVKFQTVLHNYKNSNPNEYGTINIKNDCANSDMPASAIVYWTVGAEASCEVQNSLANMIYDGELKIKTDYTQSELSNALENGEFVFHSMNGTVRVLDDINTFVSASNDKGDEFKSNQTIRVIDAIGTSFANVFNNKYYGKYNNDSHSRIALKNDFSKILETLYGLGAIDEFSSDDITVSEGDTKSSVLCELKIVIAGVMTHLYVMANVG